RCRCSRQLNFQCCISSDEHFRFPIADWSGNSQVHQIGNRQLPIENVFMSRALHRFAVLVACATFFLIIAGANVTSHDAGLAVPDWPRSFGKVFPQMVGNVFWEHGHRMVATAVGILTILMAVYVQLRERRTWVKRLGWG